MPRVPMTYDEYIDSLEAENDGRATALRACYDITCDGALRGVVGNYVSRGFDPTRIDKLRCGHEVL